jgi:hypothetical protein
VQNIPHWRPSVRGFRHLVLQSTYFFLSQEYAASVTWLAD